MTPEEDLLSAPAGCHSGHIVASILSLQAERSTEAEAPEMFRPAGSEH